MAPAAVGCRDEIDRPAAPAKILLVSIDTTRADHLSAYGYPRPTTPWLETLARGGVRFEHCYAAMPTTDPSHATMLTGQYPRTHGIMRNAARRRDPQAPTLGSWLRARGYATAAITARLGLDPHSRGLAGFDHGDAPQLPRTHRTAGEIVSLVEAWLSRRDSEPERPWFLWAHLWEPHKPYRADTVDLAQIAPGVAIDPAASSDPPRFLGPGELVAREVIDGSTALYDAEIRSADEAVRRFVALAEAAAPAGARALVLVVSDHGESLAERQATRQVAFGHGALLYDEVVRVPWIVSWPGVIGPGVVRTPVSLVDLAATVMDLVEPGAGFDTEGRSLAVSMLSGREPALAPIFVERRLFSTHPLAYLRDAETALVEYPWKLIVNEGRNAPELYRLDRDSRERYDLADLEHGRARAMVARLEKWKRDRPLGPMAHGPGRRRAAEREALHALGYID